MMKAHIIFLSAIFSLQSFGKDCGPIPPGVSFGPNCEITAPAPPPYKPELDISLESGSKQEKKAKSLVKGFVKKYDLSKYFFTNKIHIQSFVPAHSHPVLTLNTRTIQEPDRFLAVFIHEQIHWFFDDNSRTEKTSAFVKKMKEKYPKVPSEKEGGASDDESTYLHLGVCYFELEQLSKLIGRKKAVQVFKTDDIYPWVRKEVLSNKDFIQSALNEAGLQWQNAESK